MSARVELLLDELQMDATRDRMIVLVPLRPARLSEVLGKHCTFPKIQYNNRKLATYSEIWRTT